MENWKEELVSFFNGQDNRRVEVHTALNRMLQELKNENGIRSATMDIASEDPLAWKIEINRVFRTITEKEISEAQAIRAQNDYGAFEDTGETRSVEEALQTLLKNKFSK